MGTKFRNSLALSSLAFMLLGTACSAREYVEERVYTDPYGDMYAPAYQSTYIYRDRESGVEKAGKGLAGLGDRSTKVGVGVAGKAAKSVFSVF
jgi:hypothetical protein